MGLIRFIQDHNRNVELKKMRQIQQREPLDNAKDNVHCHICGIPRGNQHFYVVNDKDRKLIVCGQCVEPFRKEIAMKNKVVGQTSNDEPLNILKVRYAKGEITKEQFEQMKKDLEK